MMLPSLYSSSRLLCLPVEVIIPILGRLECKDLLGCRTVCKAFHDVIKQSLELQYKIELYADGLVDGIGLQLTTSERLRLLLDRRRRWRTLDWTNRFEVPVPGACQAYELVDGVFAKSMVNGAPLLIRDDIGVATRDFAIDPSQDLVAYVDADNGEHSQSCIKIYLRTISKNARHPLAALPELVSPIPLDLGSSFIQIVDDVVGMFFWVHGPGLIVWNWHTAEVVVKRTSDAMPSHTWDFSFLSSRAYMLTTTAGPGMIELYSFRGRPDAGAAEEDTSTPVVTMLLPPLRVGHEPHHFATHSGPFVRYQTRGRAFGTARESRVHLMSIHYGERGPRFHLFVLNEFLLALHTSAGQLLSAPVLEWKDWGPTHTRFLEHSVNFQWLRYVHGSRVVLPPFVSATWPLLESTLCVLDFNVHPKRADDPVPLHDPAKGCQLITEPSRVPATTVFEEDVVTSLPYLASTRSGKFHYSGFMIDDERIIGMKSMAFAEGDMSDVDVYTF